LITEDIFQYPKNQTSSHESTRDAVNTKLKY